MISLLEIWSKGIATKSRRHQGIRKLDFFYPSSLCLSAFVANNGFSSKLLVLMISVRIFSLRDISENIEGIISR